MSDDLEIKQNMLDRVLGQNKTVMAQVNFKSGNRVNGMLSKVYASENATTRDHLLCEPLYEIVQAAQTQNERGQVVDALAVHTFDARDVEAVVVLKTVEKSTLIS